MNTREHLILKNGKDITADVLFCKYNMDTKKYDVTFRGGNTYSCGYLSIEWTRKPEKLNPEPIRVFHKGRELFNIRDIYIFHANKEDYWLICFSNDCEKSYAKRNLKVVYSSLEDSNARNCINYLRQAAAINELKGESGEVLLEKQYEKVDFVGDDTAMAVYLNPVKYKIGSHNKRGLIFPFGGNASQFQAVDNALHSQISVIQGPPGTGKTQTILNIIANLLAEGKTVQVVSNNNSAIENVLEKLASPKYKMGFLVAPLGKSENKNKFVNSQTGTYPDLSGWEMDAGEQTELRKKINSQADELAGTFSRQERLAQVRLELNALRLEKKYFKQYCGENDIVPAKIKPRRSLKSETLMRLWQECNDFSERERAVSFWFKVKSVFIYGVSDWKFYKNSMSSVITLLQSLFYRVRESELDSEAAVLEKYLSDAAAERKMEELAGWSMEYLRAKLFVRYGNRNERVSFTADDLWRRSGDVVKEYPVVLSTTFSSRGCLNGVIYDYIIMDEASQVDIATGALALSGARNAVIVGDLKQLPNVIKDDMKKRSDEIFNSYKLPLGYSFSENSFLKSICSILPGVPKTLLREHYRCHPKIIGFCNQKFYNNELIIMTEDSGNTDALSLFKTTVGNHQRGRINQRQIDVIIREALPTLHGSNPEDIGIVSPYKKQAAAIVSQLDTDKIEVSTVHKFQGREKDTMVLTTVDDVVTDFSDDPYLLNVAVSRAKKRFCVVASGNGQPADSNIGDLIDYIEYNNFQVVQSKIYSIFDLLYRQYTEARITFLKKRRRVSAYDSENLMYNAIIDELNGRSHLLLDVICHQPLNMLIRDPGLLNDKERRYVMNPAAHVDFLIYNRIGKKPVLAVEVDGFRYHKRGARQYERDRMKDHIFCIYEIPLLRFPTNGSEEIAQIRRALDGYEKSR